ncbi:MAG: glycoside hydrolase [Bradyrhizobiaceae bacterium]|nr:MAG: glycoside hydrolase [Bradyrhizobiaceae bacterium]
MATRTQKGAALSVAAIAIATPFVMLWEGYAPVARHEAVDPPGVITWCFGRTNYDDPTVRAGTRFTKDECAAMLPATLEKYAVQVRGCVPQWDGLPDSVKAALTSFTYNLGAGTVCRSSAVKLVNAGNIKAACQAMMLYTRANGQVLRGLINRRTAERNLCLKGV